MMAIMRQTKVIHSSEHLSSDYIQELSERIDFQNKLTNLRARWNIDVSSEIFLSEKHTELTEQFKLAKNKKFTAEVALFQKHFNLGEEWSSFIKTYVFIDFVTYKKESEFFLEKRTGKDGDQITGMPAYYLRIFPKTTQQEIIKAWPEINDFIGGSKVKTIRNKPSKNLERDRTIYQLAKLGMSIEEINQYIKVLFGLDLDTFRMRSAVIRYAKKMKIEEVPKVMYKKNK